MQHHAGAAVLWRVGPGAAVLLGQIVPRLLSRKGVGHRLHRRGRQRRGEGVRDRQAAALGGSAHGSRCGHATAATAGAAAACGSRVAAAQGC